MEKEEKKYNKSLHINIVEPRSTPTKKNKKKAGGGQKFGTRNMEGNHKR